MSRVESEPLAAPSGDGRRDAPTSTPHGLKLRRNIEALSSQELADYREAITRMLQTLEGPGSYYIIAGIPGLPGFAVQHRNNLFLPWNRMMLHSFELAVGIFCPVALPWWDWASPNARRRLPAAFIEPAVAGRPNPLYAVDFPPVVSEQGGDEGRRHTYREPADPTQLPTAQEIERVLGLTGFEEFSGALEQLHNRVHGWVGGSLGTVALSAYDPLYWSLQANVDRLWRVWQSRHGTPGLPADAAETVLIPFNARAEETLDIGALGYDYDAGGGVAAQTAGATGASSDRPSAEGGFGFKAYADAFATLIASPLTTPPLTIGIYASWGMGKSSLLGQIAERLEPEKQMDRSGARLGPLARWRARQAEHATPGGSRKPKRVHVVEFNAWDYNASELVWPALVRRTMDCVEANTPQRWWAKYGHRLRRNVRREWERQRGRVLATAVVAVVLCVFAIARLDVSAASISIAAALLGGAGIVGLLGKAVSSPVSGWLGTMLEDTKYGRATDMMHDIRDDLVELGERLGDSTRMLIVIDDLDRCDASKAVEVLQAINLLLNFEGFVVCIGVDARILTAAIETHYSGLLGHAGASGYEYLDKIIQVPFRIPSPTTKHLDEFLRHEVSVDPAFPGESASEVAFEDPRQSMDGSAQSASAGLDAPGDGAPIALKPTPEQDGADDESPFLADERQAFIDVSTYLRPNPRHIKRLINVYRLVRTLAEQAGEQTVLEHRITVIRWLAISAQWPYSSYVMTRRFEQLQAADELDASATRGRLLGWLYEVSIPAIDPDARARLDEDPERLTSLLADTGTDLAPEDFATIQRYTINFNPAVAELPVVAVGSGQAAEPSRHRRSTEPIRVRLPELVDRIDRLTTAEAARLLEVREESVKRAARELSDQGLIELHGAVLSRAAAAGGAHVAQ